MIAANIPKKSPKLKILQVSYHMRKIIALIGFILIMFGIWGWSAERLQSLIGAIAPILLPFFIIFISGIIIAIIGIATNPKELREPFKRIAERFEEMDKPLLIASILILFVSLWLLSYSFTGIMYHNAAEYISYSIPENVSSGNASLAYATQSLIHNMNNTLLIFSYLDILAGILCIACVVSILEKKHLSFVIASLSFAIYVAIVFEWFFHWEINEIARIGKGVIGISVASVDIPAIPFYLLLPVIFAAIAMAIISCKYREFME